MKTFAAFMKPVLLFAAAMAMFASPVAGLAETEHHAGHQEAKKLDWPGIYYGFTPCADCIGLKTSLALNKNNSYILITQYVGKSPRDFVEKGKFTWGDQDNMIVLTPRNGGEVKYYIVEKDVLVQLDSHGKRIGGQAADKYILRRTDVTDTPSPSSHGGH